MRKIGIMGGTFNPIHVGHLIVAQESMCRYDFGEIIFIPNNKPPHRQGEDGVAGGEDRFIMVNLAIASNSHFQASRIELERPDLSYTVDTIRELSGIHPDCRFSFITGVDSLLKYPWKGFDELLDMLDRFVAATRPGFDETRLDDRLREWGIGMIHNVEILKIPGVDISSTLIRERVRNNQSIKYLVTPEVESFIMKKRLYMKDF